SGDADDECRTAGPICDGFVSETAHDFLARPSCSARAAIAFFDKPNHLAEGRSREKDTIHSPPQHDGGVRFRNGAASSAKYSNVLRIFLAEKREDLGEKFHMSAIVA